MNAIEELKGKYFPVLDHGFCAVVDSMGDDHAIARAARCSYGEGTKKTSDDRGLIRTLIREMHTSPLEMCELVVHVGLPIFVARQWVRHRTASLNEYSGRYSVMPMMFYEPDHQRHQIQSTSNKQGSADVCLQDDQYTALANDRQEVRDCMVEQYTNCLQADLTRELSRIDLPLSTYTYWYWKIDLKNLLHFLNLRLDSHAQWEIQQYGRVIAGIVKQWLPHTWEAFDDYILNGMQFSRQEQALLMSAIRTEDFSLEDPSMRTQVIAKCKDLGMTLRETTDFLNKMEFMGGGHFNNDIELDLSTAKTAEFYEKKIKEATK
jgi:thymidylate synthase (FAD)